STLDHEVMHRRQRTQTTFTQRALTMMVQRQSAVTSLHARTRTHEQRHRLRRYSRHFLLLGLGQLPQGPGRRPRPPQKAIRQRTPLLSLLGIPPTRRLPLPVQPRQQLLSERTPLCRRQPQTRYQFVHHLPKPAQAGHQRHQPTPCLGQGLPTRLPQLGRVDDLLHRLYSPFQTLADHGGTHRLAVMGVKGVIVLGHSTHCFLCLLLTLLPLSQVGRRLSLDLLGQADVAGKVRWPARWTWPTLVVLLPLPLHLRV